MYFGGFQKLTLLNYPDKMACTVFTSLCNFRCPYCHNAGLAKGESMMIPASEVISYMQHRKNVLEGVCISGGEPLMSDDILDFIQEIKNLGYAVKVDTNGSYPERLERIINEGMVDYIAMDVKNSFLKYTETIGIKTAPIVQICQSINILKKNKVEYEFRTTVVSEYHDENDIKEIAKMLEGADVWYLQSFQDSPEVAVKGLHAPDSTTMDKFSSIGNCYVKTKIRNDRRETCVM